MSSNLARYDGVSDWYEDRFTASTGSEDEAAYVTQALGTGRGQVCLDVACGTGRHGEVIARAGYTPVGIDVSADQLRFARQRLAAVRGDVTRLPFSTASIDLAVGMYFHTDVEDFAGAIREIARCLRPCGRLIYVGLHPCFIGPFIDRTSEAADRSLRFGPGYGRVGWSTQGSGGGNGLWSRVSGHPKTLATFMGAFAEVPLNLRSIREFSGGGEILPRNLGVVAEKP